MNESWLRDKVTALLKRYEYIYFEKRSPGPYTANGRPDFTGCLRGRFFAIELKHPNSKNPDSLLTTAQRDNLERVQRAGGYAVCANSVEAVEDMLRKIDGAE